MKIAHIESSINWGGQELRVVEQMQWLLANGHETHLLAREDSAIFQEARRRGLPAHALHLRGSAHPGTIAALCRLLKRERYDVLDCHSSRDANYATFARLLTGQTVVRSRHVINPIKNDFLHRYVWRAGNDFIIVTAEFIKRQIVELGLAPPERIHVAVPGVDASRFKPELRQRAGELKQQLGIPDDHFVIANVGMIRPDKGQIYFVKACAHIAACLPRAVFIQAGDATRLSGAYREEVLAEVRRSGLQDRFRFLGYREDIENCLAMSDVVVIASIATEGRTRLVSQAYFCGANVVASDVGGLPEMVRDESTGLTAPAADPGAMARQVLRLLEDRTLAGRLRDNALDYARANLTMEDMMRGMLDAYASAVAPGGPR